MVERIKKKWIRPKFAIKDGNDGDDDSGGGGFKYKISFTVWFTILGRNFYMYLLHSRDFMNETLFLYQ